MNRKRTVLASLATGVILAGFPLVAIARHSYIQEQDTHFTVEANISPRSDVENFDIWSDLNMLDLESLSGGNNFLRGQTVFVHMSKGPNNIAYPFAITADRPNVIDDAVFTIRGKVTGHQDAKLIIRYNFETFLPSEAIKNVVRSDPASPAKTILAINDKGAARLVSVEIGGNIYPYRKMELPSFESFSKQAVETAK